MTSSNETKKTAAITFLCVLCCIFAFSTVWFAVREHRMRVRERTVNERAVSSLCESLDSISTSLKKSVYTADAQALERLGNELCRQAAAAKESLGLLSVDTEICDGVYRFLSQVGDYTVAISRNSSVTREEKAENLQKLSRYADGISSGINEICMDYYNGDVSLGEVVGNLEKSGDAVPEDFYARFSDTAQTLTEYPTLIYDGPFSDGVSKRESVFLKEKSELTAGEAMQRAADAFEIPVSALKKEEDIMSQPERYCFSVGGSDITVTKRGGYICTLLTDTYAFEATIGAEEAVKRGRAYLEKLGYSGMVSSYYSIYDGICTVNYAYENEGVIYYADLIKVSIALDTGKLAGLDARSYLMSHRDRNNARARLDEEEVKAMIMPGLDVIDCRNAVIPLDTGKEAYCYELHCRDKDKKEMLIYINALTGRQEDLLILLYSDGGILTK